MKPIKMKPEFEEIIDQLIIIAKDRFKKKLENIDFTNQLIKDIEEAAKMSISTTVTVNGETHVFKATSKGVEVKKVE